MQQTVTQTYDVWNQWIRRQVDTGSPLVADTYFIYDAGQMVMSFNALRASNMAQGRISSGTCYLWGPAVDQLLAEEGVRLQGSEGTLWQLTDNLGSVRDLAEYDEASGTTSVVNHITYDSFGNVTSETAAVDHLFGYTGRAYDEETDLQNNLNRWYDAASGKWLSEDPIGFAAGDANLYRYVGNNATNATDPEGTNAVNALIKLAVDTALQKAWGQVLDGVAADGGHRAVSTLAVRLIVIQYHIDGKSRGSLKVNAAIAQGVGFNLAKWQRNKTRTAGTTPTTITSIIGETTLHYVIACNDPVCPNSGTIHWEVRFKQTIKVTDRASGISSSRSRYIFSTGGYTCNAACNN